MDHSNILFGLLTYLKKHPAAALGILNTLTLNTGAKAKAKDKSKSRGLDANGGSGDDEDDRARGLCHYHYTSAFVLPFALWISMSIEFDFDTYLIRVAFFIPTSIYFSIYFYVWFQTRLRGAPARHADLPSLLRHGALWCPLSADVYPFEQFKREVRAVGEEEGENAY
ncbi:hypothetical protein DXG01_001212 [Tephrocybe rancida]|nr:hypothetical protein DXG01_001212 [Tephrocybe rancida]